MPLLPQDRQSQVMLLITIGMAALGYAFWNYWAKPTGEEIDAIQTEVGQMEAVIAQAKADLASGTVEDLRRKVEEYTALRGVMRRLVPEKNEVPALIDDISPKAKVRGGPTGRIEPQPVEAGPPFDTYRYRLEIIGHYDQLGEFLSDIASLPRIIVPQDVILKAAAQQAQKLLRSEEHTSELQSLAYLVCRLLLEKKKENYDKYVLLATIKYTATSLLRPYLQFLFLYFFLSGSLRFFFFFFFNDTATTEIYTLSLHDALPISLRPAGRVPVRHREPAAHHRPAGCDPQGGRAAGAKAAGRHARRAARGAIRDPHVRESGGAGCGAGQEGRGGRPVSTRFVGCGAAPLAAGPLAAQAKPNPAAAAKPDSAKIGRA